MACGFPQLSPFFLRSRFLKASLHYSSPTALHAGFVESDSDILFSRTAAFRATMIIVGLLIIVLIFIARWDSILECLFCHRFLPSSSFSQRDRQQQQMLNTEMQKVWSRHAVINAVPMIKYSAMTSSPECKGSATTECMICLGEFSDGDMIRILPECRHFFHAKCIDLWFVCHISCPACRTTIAPAGSALFFQVAS